MEGGSKGDGWIMSDHKRVGLHRAFSQSGLSAAPGSNIHLAWCIPGLETLMWFVGESRWQVHGSTLLTDSAGASGRLHNNTQCLGPPFFLFCRSIPHTPKTYHRHTHTHTHIFFFWYQCVGTRRLHREPFGSCDLLFSTLVSSHCPFRFHASLSVPLTSFLYASLLSYFITLTLLLPQHSCTCPLTHPPSSFGSYSLHQSLASFLFLHLFYSTFSHRACIGNSMSCPPTVACVEMMSCNRSKSINILLVQWGMSMRVVALGPKMKWETNQSKNIYLCDFHNFAALV